MEKISGILPPSPRITSVNTQESTAARPGAPTFGREVGSATPAKGFRGETADIATKERRELMDIRKNESKEKNIVEEIANDFFMRQMEEEARLPNPIEVGSEESMDAPEVGRHLDVQA